MTNAQTGTLVLKDTAGSYFLVSQETLEQGRVPEEHKAEVEQTIVAARGATGGEDVQGYLLGAAIFGGGFVLGFVGMKSYIEASELEDKATAAAMAQQALAAAAQGRAMGLK